MTRAENIRIPETGWVVTSGHAGHQEPAIGVFEAMGIRPKVIRVAPGAPFRFLAPYGPAARHPKIAPPWPDVVLVSGRQSIPYARAIRKRSGGRTFTAVLQNPVAGIKGFDLVWVNEHDALCGDNVIRTVTTPNRVNVARLKDGAAALRTHTPVLTDRVLGVVIGGSSRFYHFRAVEAEALGEALAKFATEHGFSVAVTPSRRTGKANTDIVRDKLSGVPSWVWDGTGDNPYFGILGIAERLVVTCDSVNMLGEAAYTAKPIHAWRLPGTSDKIGAFHKDLIAHGAIRWFDGTCETWDYAPLDATRYVADEIISRYMERNGRRSIE
ncbi:mitochondrial fission ELM1 family protein [Rhodobium gokarnense]|uniref:Mitochondrial fission protein ELM1 n=1 Tax=Rhodobium gokarnense TaxID=364296 RepID=A0ABT3H602_9HYPH|nr:mitochondrial fission ELM1 family protein [Rhodobium gokarnense]MCW2305809.1 mitochondrial fission protein ELM1 [Rhodobium gokarnense]